MLIPDEILKTIPPLYSQENEGADAVAYVKNIEEFRQMADSNRK